MNRLVPGIPSMSFTQSASGLRGPLPPIPFSPSRSRSPVRSQCNLGPFSKLLILFIQLVFLLYSLSLRLYEEFLDFRRCTAHEDTSLSTYRAALFLKAFNALVDFLQSEYRFSTLCPLFSISASSSDSKPLNISCFLRWTTTRGLTAILSQKRYKPPSCNLHNRVSETSGLTETQLGL